MIFKKYSFFSNKIILIKIFALILIASTYSQEIPIQKHNLTIGFNVGYLSDIYKCKDSVFFEIYEDGYRTLRIYEPFIKNDTDLNILKSRLSYLLEKNFKILLCLSNFPYNNSFEASKITYPDKNKILKYSNRYPPDSPRDLSSYINKIKSILDYFPEYISAGKLTFEIGNEPDAPRFYWGSYDQFFSLHRHTINLLRSHDIKPLCCGFTANFMFNHSVSYFSNFFLDTSIINNVQISYHVYTNKIKSYTSNFLLQNKQNQYLNLLEKFHVLQFLATLPYCL